MSWPSWMAPNLKGAGDYDRAAAPAGIVLTRIADADDGDTQGVDRQEKDSRRHADRLGWTRPRGDPRDRENDTSATTAEGVPGVLPAGASLPVPAAAWRAKRDTVLRTIRPEFGALSTCSAAGRRTG